MKPSSTPKYISSSSPRRHQHDPVPTLQDEVTSSLLHSTNCEACNTQFLLFSTQPVNAQPAPHHPRKHPYNSTNPYCVIPTTSICHLPCMTSTIPTNNLSAPGATTTATSKEPSKAFFEILAPSGMQLVCNTTETLDDLLIGVVHVNQLITELQHTIVALRESSRRRESILMELLTEARASNLMHPRNNPTVSMHKETRKAKEPHLSKEWQHGCMMQQLIDKEPMITGPPPMRTNTNSQHPPILSTKQQHAARKRKLPAFDSGNEGDFDEADEVLCRGRVPPPQSYQPKRRRRHESSSARHREVIEISSNEDYGLNTGDAQIDVIYTRGDGGGDRRESEFREEQSSPEAHLGTSSYYFGQRLTHTPPAATISSPFSTVAAIPDSLATSASTLKCNRQHKLQQRRSKAQDLQISIPKRRL